MPSGQQPLGTLAGDPPPLHMCCPSAPAAARKLPGSPLVGRAVDQRQLDEVQLHVLAPVLDAVRRYTAGALQRHLDRACTGSCNACIEQGHGNWRRQTPEGSSGSSRGMRGWRGAPPDPPPPPPPPMTGAHCGSVLPPSPPRPPGAGRPAGQGRAALPAQPTPPTVGSDRHVDRDVHVSAALVAVADAQPKVPLGLTDGEGACAKRWRVPRSTSGSEKAPAVLRGTSRGRAAPGVRAPSPGPQAHRQAPWLRARTAPVPLVLLAVGSGTHYQLARQLSIVPVHGSPARRGM